jgi:hypothetical protein
MLLFIDTNIFLSFYHLTSEDLEELEKLAVLIKNKELILLLPNQVIDETRRNRASKINDSFSNFKNAKFKISYPAYCKDYEQYSQMRATVLEAEKYHAEIVNAIQQDIEKHALKADLLLEGLFKIASVIERTSEIVESAKERVSLGNPPGKKDSLGDAINWESLLQGVGKRAPIHLITDDSDFYSPLNSEMFNEFLDAEWKDKNKSKIYFYRRLSDFFKKTFPKINLTTELEKEGLIEELSSSSSFAQTHSLIAKLSNYEGFTQKQAEDLARALVNNNQVNWIIDDVDVYEFYKKLDEDCVIIFEDYYDKFEALLEKGNPANKSPLSGNK